MRFFDLDNLTSNTIIAHSRSITNISWSHDQKYVAIASNDGTSSIWTIKNKILSNDAVYFGKGLHTKSIAWNTDDTSVAYLQNNNNVSVFSANGEFQYSIKINGQNSNAVIWKGGKPVGIQSNKKSFEFNEKVYVRIEDRNLELIPLNNNSFALIDSLNNIIHGDKNDFIQLSENENKKGFVNLKSIE